MKIEYELSNSEGIIMTRVKTISLAEHYIQRYNWTVTEV